MRISIDRCDPGFRPAILSGVPQERYDVLLDGEPIGAVVTADEEQGLVLVYERDEEGRWRHVDGVLTHRELRGIVEIRRL